MADRALAPRAPFAGLLHPPAHDAAGTPGVVVAPRAGLQLATVIARRGDRAALAEGLRQACGLALPQGPRRTTAGRFAALGTGPRSWLVVEADGADGLAGRLSRTLGAAAAVCDQSDGYAVLRIAGPRARAVLAKGLAIDLHPRAFDPTRVAASTCAHIGVTVWQTDEVPSFEIALSRSFAGSFAHWLEESAAEFGCEVRSSA